MAAVAAPIKPAAVELSILQSAEPLLRTRTSEAIEARPARAGARTGDSIGLTVETDLARVATVWRGFERAADCTVFQTFAWQSTWQAHIGAPRGVVPAIVIGRRADRSILFIMPLAVEGNRPFRRLTWLAADLCDYNGPLLAPDFAERVDAARFVQLWQEIEHLLLSRNELCFDAVVLEQMPASIGGQPNPFLALGATLNPSGAYVSRLSGDYDAYYLAKRSAARRKSDRWKQRRLADHGEVRFVTAEGASETGRVLDVLFAQKARSLARIGVADMFAAPGRAAFFRAVVAALGPIAHVSHLDVGPAVAAANVGLVFRGRYYHMLASHTDGEVGRFGPGTIHLQHLIADAIERGCGLFDFTVGDEAYKREWCDEELKLYDLRRAATPGGMVVALASGLAARVKRAIKQTPWLWRIAFRLRTIVGQISRTKDSTREDRP